MQLAIPPGEFAGTIFDLDGTLIDSMPVHYRAWDAAMRAFGLKQALDEDLFYALGGISTRKVAEMFAAHYRMALDPDEVMTLKERLYRGFLPDVRLIEPVVVLARRAAALHPVAIVTGGLRDVAVPALETTGLSTLFRIVVTPDDVPVGRGKPAPDMFLLAAERMGVEPERCLVFEDAEPGLQGAREAGMATVRVPSRLAAGRD